MRTMSRISPRRLVVLPLLAIGLFSPGIERGFAADGAAGRFAEHVILTNGFDLICDHREQTGDRVRLYTEADNSNFVEVGAADVASVETILLPAVALPASATAKRTSAMHADLTKAELHELLSSAGARHNLDVNLLASVVRAESGGHTAAVSRKGAQGLMQLMPKTAAQLGVSDSLRPEENVAGGASYLDSLLTRYHDNLALALAAYNAGPAAVDRWHGVPPYRETRLYVARIIRDFNASVRNASRNESLDAAKLSHPDTQLKNIVAQAGHEQVSLTGATAP
jgi:soluble lytic murein transglycosylase-like protein